MAMMSIISTMTDSAADTAKLQTQLLDYRQLSHIDQKIVQLFFGDL